MRTPVTDTGFGKTCIRNMHYSYRVCTYSFGQSNAATELPESRRLLDTQKEKYLPIKSVAGSGAGQYSFCEPSSCPCERRAVVVASAIRVHRSQMLDLFLPGVVKLGTVDPLSRRRLRMQRPYSRMI